MIFFQINHPKASLCYVTYNDSRQEKGFAKSHGAKRKGLRCSSIKLETALFILSLGRNDNRYGFLNGEYIGQVEEFTPVMVTNTGSMHVVRNQERGGLQYVSPWHATIGVPSKLRFFTLQH